MQEVVRAEEKGKQEKEKRNIAVAGGERLIIISFDRLSTFCDGESSSPFGRNSL